MSRWSNAVLIKLQPRLVRSVFSPVCSNKKKTLYYYKIGKKNGINVSFQKVYVSKVYLFKTSAGSRYLFWSLLAGYTIEKIYTGYTFVRMTRPKRSGDTPRTKQKHIFYTFYIFYIFYRSLRDCVSQSESVK